ncbi:hypothetical protein PAXRUDRAFT_21670 [Paxillus rubicundulus Ve08.2h10]|uniref:Integrase catalytic domain-containing protein n=1 Tax=Paxillus rubicundulus Ve08.2h10 TaxID=930991 RepID=A0A0D0CPH4_9AGAM|nr:hypothetical protein PAXRUDRAFT_21670 [Paxillus rubicundulus Ve08.2h10]
MKHKNEALQIYNRWKVNVQMLFHMESDRGGEYINQAFRDQLQKDRTMHETSAPYTPEQNGLVEWMNQMLSLLANTMLEES